MQKLKKGHKKITSSQLVIFLRSGLFASALNILPNLTIRKLKIGKILNGCFAVLILAKGRDISVAYVTEKYLKNIVIIKLVLQINFVNNVSKRLGISVAYATEHKKIYFYTY